MHSNRMQRGGAGLVIVFLLAIIAAGGAYWWWTQTPEYALYQVKQAAKSHDKARFYQFFAVEDVVSNAMQTTIDSTVDTGSALGDTLAKTFATGMATLIKPKAVGVARERIDRFIESGPPQQGQEDALNYLMRLARDTATSEWSRKEGKIAVMGVRVTDAEKNKSWLFEWRLREVNGKYQFFELVNVGAVTKQILEDPSLGVKL